MARRSTNPAVQAGLDKIAETEQVMPKPEKMIGYLVLEAAELLKKPKPAPAPPRPLTPLEKLWPSRFKISGDQWRNLTRRVKSRH
jgi:hypothetical protein